MKLIDRIDIALQHAGKSRGQLAEAIDLSTQAISNLKRRPGSTLRPENVAKAAKWLKCDLYWLCTGEPEHYQPEMANYGALAREVARWIDTLPAMEQERAFTRIYMVCRESHAGLGLSLPKSGGGDDARLTP
jgi:hypothetical protein